MSQYDLVSAQTSNVCNTRHAALNAITSMCQATCVVTLVQCEQEGWDRGRWVGINTLTLVYIIAVMEFYASITHACTLRMICMCVCMYVCMYVQQTHPHLQHYVSVPRQKPTIRLPMGQKIHTHLRKPAEAEPSSKKVNLPLAKLDMLFSTHLQVSEVWPQITSPTNGHSRQLLVCSRL